MELKPIGMIHSLYKERHEAPRQGRFCEHPSVIEIFPEFQPALKGIEKVSHVFVLYWLDQADRQVLQSPTSFSETPLGVFVSRSPNRPNPIALCIAEILEIDGNRLTVCGVDALDGSPLLDMKIYSPEIDSVPDAQGYKMPSNVSEIFSKDHRGS